MTGQPASGALGATAAPADEGFFLPADGARHARMWLAWPREEAARSAVAQIAQTVVRYEPVTLIAAPGDEGAARAACPGASVVALNFASARLRDIGPCFLIDGKGGSAAIDGAFRGWGGRGAAESDNAFAHALLGEAEVRRFRSALQLEGGACSADGEGTVLALAASLFDAARNPGVSRLETFAVLRKYLGAARVIWIEHARSDDALLADLRAVASFLAPGVVAVSSAPAGHPDAERLAETRGSLSRVKDALGRPLTLVDLPVPRGEPLAAPGVPLSYTAFLPVNGAVLMPTYNAADDELAREVLARAFPTCVIEPVPARALAAHGLSLTTLTLPQPARLLQRDRATMLPRSAWAQPAPDVDELLQKYIDLARER